MAFVDALAFGAHPDDVELMCAATMAKLKKLGYKTGVVSLTKAELGTRGTPEIRQKESAKAAEILGLSENAILDIPDGQVTVNQENRLIVVEQIRKFRPQIIFTPYWKTRHPDHGNCSLLVKEAAFLAGLKNIKTNHEPHRPAKVIYYMELYDFKPSFIVDVSETFDDKIKSIKAYESQFHSNNEDNESQGATYISTPEFLQTIITKGEYWGQKIGAKYGEPFLIREAIHLDDPVKHFGGHQFAGLL